MEELKKEVETISPQLSDKLGVLIGLLREMREEDLDLVDGFVQAEKSYRARHPEAPHLGQRENDEGPNLTSSL